MKVHLMVTADGRRRTHPRCNFTLRPRVEFQTRDIALVTCKNCLGRWNEELTAAIKAANAKTLLNTSLTFIQAISK